MNDAFQGSTNALRNQLLAQLAPLASLAYQRRYIVHGDARNYVLSDELIDPLDRTLRLFRYERHHHSFFSLPQFAALDQLRGLVARFLADLDDVPLEDISNEELIERHAGWRAIREQSAICLKLFGFDLDSWQERESEGTYLS